MPCYSYGQKLSKLAILRIACNYILSLAQLAELDYSSDHSTVSFSQCVEQCTRTLQAEGRCKKRKVSPNIKRNLQKLINIMLQKNSKNIIKLLCLFKDVNTGVKMKTICWRAVKLRIFYKDEKNVIVLVCTYHCHSYHWNHLKMTKVMKNY